MASSDYSNDYRIVHDRDAGSCAVFFRCFDTPNSICVYGIDGDFDAYRMEDLLVAARRTCLELHRLWSFTMPGSDVSRINCAVAATEVSEHTARLLSHMKEYHETEPIVLELTDEAAVTSGSYERFVEIDGRRYQHIVDASTGYPVESDVVSATVVAPHALEADLLATTACLVGSRGLPDLAMRHPACRFVVITDDARVLRA